MIVRFRPIDTKWWYMSADHMSSVIFNVLLGFCSARVYLRVLWLLNGVRQPIFFVNGGGGGCPCFISHCRWTLWCLTFFVNGAVALSAYAWIHQSRGISRRMLIGVRASYRARATATQNSRANCGQLIWNCCDLAAYFCFISHCRWTLWCLTDMSSRLKTHSLVVSFC